MEIGILPLVVGMAFVIILVGVVMRIFKQPYVLAYIVAGIVMGLLGIAGNSKTLEYASSVGIVILLFFVGMDISLPSLMKKWRIAFIGTFAQILVSVGVMFLIGHWLGWSTARSILLGFVITLSSTAVILNILEEWGELKSKMGQNVLGICIVQDIALVPMLLVLSFLDKGPIEAQDVLLPIIGGVLIVSLLIIIRMKKDFQLRFLRKFKNDHELQIFVALLFCFGFAWLTGFFGLSTALGAFVAGILVSSAKETQWVSRAMHPFRVVLVAIFFVYIGILIDVWFLLNNIWLVLALTGLVLLLNTLINATVLYWLGNRLEESIYNGSILSQIGEFSFLFAAMGLAAGIIGAFEHQLVVSVIAVSLLLSPFWIILIRKSLKSLPADVLCKRHK